MMKKDIFSIILVSIIFSSAYSQASYFDDNSKLFGIKDSLGNDIIKPKYQYLSVFTNQNSCVFFNGEKYGLLNQFGEVVLNPLYKNECSLYDSEYSEGLINIVKRKFLNNDSTSWNEERGYVNKEGKLKIDFMPIEFAGKFCKGKAIIGKYNDEYDFIYNVIDTNGKLILNEWVFDYNSLNYINICSIEKTINVETLKKEKINDSLFLYKNEKISLETNLSDFSYAIYYHVEIDRVLIFTNDHRLYLLNGKGKIIKEITLNLDLDRKKWHLGQQFYNNGIIQVSVINENFEGDTFLLNNGGELLRKMIENAPSFRDDCNYGNH